MMRWTALLLALAIGLIPAIGSLTALPETPRLVLDAEVVWRARAAGFGGFSGIAVQNAGADFLTVSDRGSWARARMRRADGRLTAVDLASIGPLRAISGQPLDGENIDAEGLALDPQGRAYVSFEAFHRVRRYAPIDGPAAEVAGHPDFPGLQNNSGLEALAFDGAGTLYAIPERSGALQRPFPVYRLRDGRWDKSLRVRRDGTFLVVDADVGPDGRLYLLERDFKWFGGFATRVRSFAFTPDGLNDEALLVETPFGVLDNMEGISVWRDTAGRIRATLISDDNFHPLQRTVVAEFLLESG